MATENSRVMENWPEQCKEFKRKDKRADEQQLLELFDGHAFTSLRVTAGDRSDERCQRAPCRCPRPSPKKELRQ